MAQVFMAPAQPPICKLFLAGSIDMGAAINWQEAVTNALADEPVTIFNPRRTDWDSSWKQSIDNDQFFEQVDWELTQLEASDIICYYFDPKGQAPITLMELGLHIRDPHKDIIVCCPDGFWRKGNVEMVCDRYNIPLYDYIGDMISGIKSSINRIKYAQA